MRHLLHFGDYERVAVQVLREEPGGLAADARGKLQVTIDTKPADASFEPKP